METQMHLHCDDDVVISAIWDKIPCRSKRYAVITICEKESEIALFADEEIVDKLLTCLNKLTK